MEPFPGSNNKHTLSLPDSKPGKEMGQPVNPGVTRNGFDLSDIRSDVKKGLAAGKVLLQTKKKRVEGRPLSAERTGHKECTDTKHEKRMISWKGLILWKKNH